MGLEEHLPAGFKDGYGDAAGLRPDAVPEMGRDPRPLRRRSQPLCPGRAGYRSDLPYEVLTDRVRPWSYAEFEGHHVTVSSMLAEAMRHNPHLRVYVGCGYYDGATPFFAAEHAFAHLDIPDELRSNISFEYHGAGHMMYVHEPSRLRQSATHAVFVSAAAPTS